MWRWEKREKEGKRSVKGALITGYFCRHLGSVLLGNSSEDTWNICEQATGMADALSTTTTPKKYRVKGDEG